MILTDTIDDGIGNLAPIFSAGGTAAAGVLTAAPATFAGILGVSAAAIPLIGAAVAGVTLLVSYFLNKNSQYHAQETATTQIVNQAEQLMKQNLAAWQQSSKNLAEQQQALENFNQIWAEVGKACNQPQYADPGQRCINDRNRGGKWDWFSYYYDPIANDPNVVQPSASNLLSSITSGSFDPTYIVLGGLVLLVISL